MSVDARGSRRRAFVAVFGLAASGLAAARAVARIVRVGFLALGARPPDGAPPAALTDEMRRLGYVEGRNVAYFGRWAEARSERLEPLARELVGLGVDVIVTFGGKSTQAAKAATSKIPVVFTNAADPVHSRLVASFPRPGGNVTGISDQAVDLSAKRLELLGELVPSAVRIAVLWNADNVEMTMRFNRIEDAASKLRLKVVPVDVREPEDFANAFSAMSRQRPDALMLVTDALTSLNRRRIVEFAAEHAIPAMYEYGFIVREGGLISYGPDFGDLFRRAAVYVDRILGGMKPGELPVEMPTNYYLLVNLGTARALGLAIPQSLLLRADEVVG